MGWGSPLNFVVIIITIALISLLPILVLSVHLFIVYAVISSTCTDQLHVFVFGVVLNFSVIYETHTYVYMYMYIYM